MTIFDETMNTPVRGNRKRIEFQWSPEALNAAAFEYAKNEKMSGDVLNQAIAIDVEKLKRYLND